MLGYREKKWWWMGSVGKTAIANVCENGAGGGAEELLGFVYVDLSGVASLSVPSEDLGDSDRVVAYKSQDDEP